LESLFFAAFSGQEIFLNTFKLVLASMLGKSVCIATALEQIRILGPCIPLAFKLLSMSVAEVADFTHLLQFEPFCRRACPGLPWERGAAEWEPAEPALSEVEWAKSRAKPWIEPESSLASPVQFESLLLAGAVDA
jgi:hypothetical protein